MCLWKKSNGSNEQKKQYLSSCVSLARSYQLYVYKQCAALFLIRLAFFVSIFFLTQPPSPSLSVYVFPMSKLQTHVRLYIERGYSSQSSTTIYERKERELLDITCCYWFVFYDRPDTNFACEKCIALSKVCIFIYIYGVFSSLLHLHATHTYPICRLWYSNAATNGVWWKASKKKSKKKRWKVGE